MADISITIRQGDSILARYGNQLAYLSDVEAKTVFARALNHEGDKGRTQVKRELVTATGIKYSLINRGMATHRANKGRLEYRLDQKGSETNLGLFNARATGKGVSAAPWNKRQIFRGDNPSRGSFFLPGTKLVFIRVGAPRYPIKPLFGPNLAREIVKDKPAAAWTAVATSLADRIGHEIGRLLPG